MKLARRDGSRQRCRLHCSSTARHDRARARSASVLSSDRSKWAAGRRSSRSAFAPRTGVSARRMWKNIWLVEMLTRLRTYASFVRISHTVFALPFALVGALLAMRTGVPTAWSWPRLGWILACMVTARSAAMGFNRLADADHDARNPRTAMRELPSGRMARGEAVAFVVIATLLFIASAWMVSPLAFGLAPVALAIVFWYSLAKR